MNGLILIVALGFVSTVIVLVANARKKRLLYVDRYRFHSAVRRAFRKKHPDLTQEQEDLVFKALRQYFHICNKAGRKIVAMPSQVVDDAWHAFILFTRAYQTFCRKALGRFLHHTPAEAMRSRTLAQDGIKRAWRIACAQEGINPKTPNQLPLIFAIDSLLNIPDGFYYSTDCTSAKGRGDTAYCGSDIGCASGCSGDSGSDSAGGCSSDSGGCSSGCSGGCGGD